MGRDSERVRVSPGRSSDRRRRHERGSSSSDEDGEIPTHRDLDRKRIHRSGSSSSDSEIPIKRDLGRKIDRRRHDSGSSSSSDGEEQDLHKISKKTEPGRERRDKDQRRRHDSGSDNEEQDLEKISKKTEPGRERRDKDQRRRHDSGSDNEEEDLEKISKKRDRGREREGRIHHGSRDRDVKEEEKKLTERKKSPVNTDKERGRREEDRRRKHERKSLSDEEGEIQIDKDLRRKANRRRHDSDSSSSDQEENLDKKRKNQNGGIKDEQRHRDHRRRDDEKEEKRKSLSKERARHSEDRYSDREKEKKRSERKQDDRHDRGREREDGDRNRRRDRDGHEYNGRKRVTGEDKNENRPRIPVKEWIEHDRRYDNRNKIERKDTDEDNPNNVVNVDNATSGKSGGVYLPPFKLAQMMNKVEDKSSVEYQRLTWDALRKSINGLVNKVNATNIKNIITELFEENLIRGRGLFCRSCMKSQMASPGFTDVFAALVAVVNTKFPEVGELLLRRIVLQLKRAYKRNDKHQLLAAVKFVAHLVNQQVAHEILALELLTVLLDKISDDSVEVAVGFVTECGSLLQDLSPRGLDGIFERFRGILHEGEIDKRVQFLIEGLFAIRKAKFQGHPAVRPELDLVDQEDQLTHEISLDDKIDPETNLDIFKPDPQFLENEKRYEELVKNILGDESVKDEESSEESSDDEEDEDSEEEEEEQMKIKDETETNLVNLRRTIYLTIMSSVDFEEAGHKLLKIKLEPGQEMELCIMLLECCSQERTYLRYYGLLGQRFCMINKIHQENFEKCFVQQYSMIHRLETNKLRNVAKFFAHLLGTDALPWHVLSYIRLTEEDTTSSSRIFIKILFQELSEHLGIRLLNERLTDPTMQDSFESIFPKDNPKNSRFSINFFTSIGLGGITENLREYLKNMPRLIMQQQQPDPDSSPGSESSSDESPSSSSESEKEASRKRRRR